MHTIHTSRPAYLPAYFKVTSSILVELIFLISFFFLFCLEKHIKPVSVLSLEFLVFFLIVITTGAGAIDAFIAERKGKSMWAWGFNASMSTLAIIMIAILVFWIWIGYALIIAPIISIPLTAFLMDSEATQF